MIKYTLIKSAISIFLLAILWAGCKKDDNTGIEGVCPEVVATSPVDKATNVPLNKIITIAFNTKLDPKTITQDCFILQGPSRVNGLITYDDASATISFKPTLPLTSNTTYTGRVLTTVTDPMGNALQTDYIWTFSTGDSLSPMVIITDPVNNAMGVQLNKIVSATFSMAMDSSTINNSTFTLKNGNTTIAVTVTYSGNTAYFTPSANLMPNTPYTATITTGAKNTLGKAMGSDYVWMFTTGTNVGPKVLSTDPTSNATNVPLNKVISATFDMPMDATSINGTTFTVKQGNNVIPGSVTYSGNTAYFTPTNNLVLGNTYTATITTGAKNVAGTPLVNDYVWMFSTGPSAPPIVLTTDPSSNATNVPLNKVVTATFNMPMDATTINTNTFTLKDGGNTVAGLVTYNGNTASFTPTSNLQSGKTYTATITTGAKNLAGTSIANDYVWTFSTAAPLGPQPPDLKTVLRFGIIAGVGVSNNAGFSVINNLDVGISPGVRSSVTGFPPATIVNGAIYASDDINPPGVAAMLTQAKLDLVAAYQYAEGATSPAPVSVSGDQGGKTLAPGIYKSNSTLLIQNGNLTLDAQGDPNAVWIFQISSGFTTVGGAGGSIVLIGGAKAGNIYWQTGSSATIGDNTSFKGNVLALTSITMNSQATADGRMLAINGSVVMTNTNTINRP